MLIPSLPELFSFVSIRTAGTCSASGWLANHGELSPDLLDVAELIRELYT
jgi:hypothetical protein